jgi:hypothetical protein
MTNARRSQTHQALARPRTFEVDFVDDQFLTRCHRYCSPDFHLDSSSEFGASEL